MKKIIQILEKSNEAIGQYNPKLKVYALGEGSCKRIWEYLCEQRKNNEEVKRINKKTKFISNIKSISQLVKKGYKSLDPITPICGPHENPKEYSKKMDRYLEKSKLIKVVQ